MCYGKRLTNMFWFCHVVLVLLCLVLSPCKESKAQAVDSAWQNTDNVKASPMSHKWGLSFGGVLMSGKVTPALLPVGEGYVGGGIPIKSPYGFGLSVDYNVNPSLRIFLDGNFYTYRKQVGIEGQESSSFWVFEMNDYATNLISFNDDAYFYMQTTGFRLGVKYGFQKYNFRPWVGTGFGFYAWKADYAIADRSESWGSDNGTATGVTFLFGLDYILGRESKNPMIITFFGDLASPVANPIIYNLFQDGWTYANHRKFELIQLKTSLNFSAPSNVFMASSNSFALNGFAIAVLNPYLP